MTFITNFNFTKYYYNDYYTNNIINIIDFLECLIIDELYIAQLEIWNPVNNSISVISEQFLIESKFSPEILHKFILEKIEVGSNEFIMYNYKQFIQNPNTFESRPLLRIKYQNLTMSV